MRKSFAITVGFDYAKTIGSIEIDEEYLDKFPEFTLAPEVLVNKNGKDTLRGVSLVSTESYLKGLERYKK